MSLLASCAIALAFGFFGSMPLAGPIAIMTVSRAAQKKFSEALHVALGAAAAEGIYAGLAFWGFTTFLARHPVVVPVSHGVTAVVLAALGVRFAFWKLEEPEEDPRGKVRAGTALVGFSISMLNPTLLVTWTAAVAFLYSKGLHDTSATAAIPFGACAAAGVGGWFFMLVRLVRRYHGHLPGALLTWTIRVLGLTLVCLGVWSGVQLATWLGGDRDRDTPAAASASLCCARADEHASARHRRRHRDAGAHRVPPQGRRAG
jgi:threonine/homoserine/homoserine lactone efflux protein